MRIEVISVHETPDGGCRMFIELDPDTMIRFAELGILNALRTAATQVLAEHADEDEG